MNGIYGNPLFCQVAGTTLRPGGLKITERALNLCRFSKDAVFLDIGCGCGGTVEFLQKVHGFQCEGIDPSKELVSSGLRRCPDLRLGVNACDALPYDGKRFDGVFMECTLSLTPRKKQRLSEAHRVLKPKGRLIISDLYAHEGSSPCASSTSSEIRAFHMETLRAFIEAAGFHIVHFEDFTPVLKAFVASFILEYGSAELLWNTLNGGTSSDEVQCGSTAFRGTQFGYFLLVAERIS